jgi:excisionase family DNA binding protein
METLLDKDAAAELLGITRRHIDYLVTMRRIPFVKVGGRTIRFRPDDLRTWVDDNRTEAVN